jgi:hypothetical protein
MFSASATSSSFTATLRLERGQHLDPGAGRSGSPGRQGAALTNGQGHRSWNGSRLAWPAPKK